MLLAEVENSSSFHWELGVFEGNKGKRGRFPCYHQGKVHHFVVL
jgi:hypothetical protein